MTEPTTRQQRILAVDDNAYTVRLVEFTLREAGFRVITALSGEEALEHIETVGLPDLALVDLHMPGISGFEFAHRVHQYSDLPIIMLTAVKMCIRDSLQPAVPARLSDDRQQRAGTVHDDLPRLVLRPHRPHPLQGADERHVRPGV